MTPHADPHANLTADHTNRSADSPINQPDDQHDVRRV